MEDGLQTSRAGEYRNQATTLRAFALQMRFAEGKLRLLALADSFDKLADRVAARGARRCR